MNYLSKAYIRAYKMADDLSDFERRRLENIRRNEAFLSSLGFTTTKEPDAVNRIKKTAQEKRARQDRSLSCAPQLRTRAQPTRYSKRLRSQEVIKEETGKDSDGEENGADEEGGVIDYSEYPEVCNILCINFVMNLPDTSCCRVLTHWTTSNSNASRCSRNGGLKLIVYCR